MIRLKTVAAIFLISTFALNGCGGGGGGIVGDPIVEGGDDGGEDNNGETNNGSNIEPQRGFQSTENKWTKITPDDNEFLGFADYIWADQENENRLVARGSLLSDERVFLTENGGATWEPTQWDDQYTNKYKILGEDIHFRNGVKGHYPMPGIIS